MTDDGNKPEGDAGVKKPVALTPETIAEVLNRAMLAAPELENQIRGVFEPSESGALLRRA